MAEQNNRSDTSLIDQLIGDDRLEDALNVFFQFLKECDNTRDELLLTQSQFTGTARDENRGLVERGSPDINRIRWAFISLVQKFRRETLARYFDTKGFEQHMMAMTDRDAFLQRVLAARLRDKRYVIKRKLQGGNSSIIYHIFNDALRTHAIAQILKQDELTSDLRKAIQKLPELKHRNVSKVFDIELDAYPFFIIKDYIHGSSLREAVEKTGRRPMSQVADWLFQLADALMYLRQKKVAHFNVRPSKIFIDEEWHLVIAPLDLSAITLKNITYERFLDICKYSSPELLQKYNPRFSHEEQMRLNHSTNDPAGDKPWPETADEQYSLGLIAYLSLTGEELFEGTSVYDILKCRERFDTDPAFRDEKLKVLEKKPVLIVNNKEQSIIPIIRRLLSTNPADRYANLHNLIRDLHPLLRADNYEGNPVQDSYRRALANNRELVSDFYQKLFQKSEQARLRFEGLGEQRELSEKRQLSMLQMALDVLFDLESRKGELHKMLSNNSHSGITKQEYAHFLDALEEVMRACDPQHDEHVEMAWDKLKKQFLDLP